MKKKPIHSISLFFFAVIPCCLMASGINPELETTNWLNDFLSQGLKEVNAGYVFSYDDEGSGSGIYEKTETYNISFIFVTKAYEKRYSLVYRDDWAVLTKGNTAPPPKQERKYAGSRISPWSNYKGVGEYKEDFQRRLPNWLIFNRLDTLIREALEYDHHLPPLTGIFLKDELKLIRKIYKKARRGHSISNLWNRFEFDDKGNVIELSSRFIDREYEKGGLIADQIKSYEVNLINDKKEKVKIFPFQSDNIGLIDGLVFQKDKKEVRIFSFELNRMFYKFTGDLFRDPDVLILDYLNELKKDCGKSLKRFESE